MDDFVQQVARYEQYLQLDPKNATLWVAFGDVLHRENALDRAESAFQRALGIQPDNSIAKARIAAVAISRHQFERAESILRELIAAGEQDHAVLFNLALSLYYQRRFDDALEVFEQVAGISRSVDARYHLLSCLHNLNRLGEAIDRGEQFLRRSPSAEVEGLLALILMDEGRMEEAVARAQAVARSQPDNADAAAVLSTHALENQEMGEAGEHLQVLTAKEPRNLRGWQGLALIELHGQRHSEALRYLERARECDPNNTGTLTTIGWTHLTAHDYGNAERTFRAGLQVDRNDAELHGGLASALVMLRQFDEARQEVTRARRLDSNCFGAAFAESVLLRLAGNEQRSTQVMADMLNSSPRQGGATLLDGLVKYWSDRSRNTSPSGRASPEQES